MSADRGISDPKALWGNLLIELRELFIGSFLSIKSPFQMNCWLQLKKLGVKCCAFQMHLHLKPVQ